MHQLNNNWILVKVKQYLENIELCCVSVSHCPVKNYTFFYVYLENTLHNIKINNINDTQTLRRNYLLVKYTNINAIVPRVWASASCIYSNLE